MRRLLAGGLALGLAAGAARSEALRPYVEAGCRTFNLLAQTADRRDIAGAVGEVRRLLNPGE